MYHGVQNGFYIGFLVTFTSYLIPLALVGVGAALYNYFYDKRNKENQTLLPFLTVLTGIWMSIFFEVWKRREKLLAYNFGVLGDDHTKKDESKAYEGQYVVDKTSGKVTIQSDEDAFVKRIFIGYPLQALLVGLTILVTYLFALWTASIENKHSAKQISQINYNGFIFLIGTLEGITLVILNELNDLLTNKITIWENHK